MNLHNDARNQEAGTMERYKPFYAACSSHGCVPHAQELFCV